MLSSLLVNVKEGDTIEINIANTLITEVEVKQVIYARKEMKAGTVFQIACPDLKDGQAFAVVTIYV